MSAPHVRYDAPPQFVLKYPECSACDIELDHDGDSWLCPKCQTAWPSNAGDGDEGELWSDWSGEGFPEERPVLTHEQGPRSEHVGAIR